MFELHGVTKTFGESEALKSIDLKIPPEKATVLIGPSGCGKSTLLRLLVGLIPPSDGEIHFRGQPLADRNIRELRHRMGYVIQDGGLFPHMTARRNATLLAEYLGWQEKDIERRIRELSEMTHFPIDGLDRYPAELSGGQRQRVSLMRALMLDPDVLLMDEPLGALDPMIRVKLQEDLRELFQTLSKTVIIVTHDLGEAVYLADHIVLMRHGEIEQQGAFKELYNHPQTEYVTEFINAQRSPLQTMVEGDHES